MEKVFCVVLMVYALSVNGIYQSNSSDSINNNWILNMNNLDFQSVPGSVFTGDGTKTKTLTEVYASGNQLRYIGKDDFPKEATKHLRYLDLSNNFIYGIHEDAFVHMTSLETIVLSGNKFKEAPVLKLSNLKNLYLNNNIISRLSHKTLHYLKTLERLVLKNNQIKELMPLTFGENNHLKYLDLSENPLMIIHPFGLNGPIQLQNLRLKRTNISSLPSYGLSSIQVLDITDTPDLIVLPKESCFKSLRNITVTYNAHCCLFKKRTITHDDHNHTSFTGHQVNCNPAPDAFNPCEDVMGSGVLRVFSWFIALLAIIGNVFLVTVMYKSKPKTVHRILMLNFGFANFLMGFYLLALCSIDAHSYGEYFDYAIKWQHNNGCKIFGFLAVFATSLSLCILVLITTEHFVWVTYSLITDYKIVMRYAKLCIAAVWVYSIVIALLPATNLVSSYTKTAICLPIDIFSRTSEAYVTWVLSKYIIGFIMIACLFVRIFKNLKAAKSMNTEAFLDTSIKRLTIVIFANFLCWLPISIIGLIALYGKFSLNVKSTKFLLVFTLPLNAAFNPILYAIFTKKFRKDLTALINSTGRQRNIEDDEKGFRYRASSYFKSLIPTSKTRSETKTSIIVHCQQPSEITRNNTHTNEKNIEAEADFPNPMNVNIDSFDQKSHLQGILHSLDLYRSDCSDSTLGLLEEYRKQINYGESFETTSTGISLKFDFESGHLNPIENVHEKKQIMYGEGEENTLV